MRDLLLLQRHRTTFVHT